MRVLISATGSTQNRCTTALPGRLGHLAMMAAIFWFLQGLNFLHAQSDVKAPKTYTELPSDIPARFETKLDGFGYTKRDLMIPMRDGVKLHTIILLPKGAKNAPILMTRTPYNASALTGHAESTNLATVLNGYDNALDVIIEGGYIRVVQDIRGKYGSEGDYVINRPLHGPQNPTPVDHSTDTYDTIDWLVKNVTESNGRVGILGISYDGFLPLMALFNPHPALKVSVPMNPMVDGWIGDDWFHNGAFRQINVNWIYEQIATRKNETKWWTSHHDLYDMFMQAGSAGELGYQRGMEQIGFWKKLIEHPTYDAFWQDQAMDKLLAKEPLKVPTMLVHGLWDQEDIYGAPAVYKALAPIEANKDKLFLVMGPWYHGQMIADGSALGAIKFHSDTAREFRQKILRPFLDQYLKEGAPNAKIPPVTAFETGTNTWRQFPTWPPAPTFKPLYLRGAEKLSFDAPVTGDAAFTDYVSDPAKPVPFRNRPIAPMQTGTWSQWLVDDQREASGRPDVLVFTTETLTAPLKISGEPIVNLVASTSGTDSDWVIKLIDVYPDQVAPQAEMGGYQLMIAADIFRGRYRESLERPTPLEPGKPLKFKFALPNANHVFLPGHKIMVQVQSSWFPLYDRNPQTFVPNIFHAQKSDYVKATQRIFHESGNPSYIELPVVDKP